MTVVLRQVRWLALVLGLILALLNGCSNRHKVPRIYHNPYPQQKSFAITPFRDLSGSGNLDVMAVTDAVYAELKHADSRNFQVIPLNRVLAALADLGFENVNRPADVAALADALAVDAVIVGAVTQYDPYFPPRLGMSVQLFLREKKDENVAISSKHINPKDLAQAAGPFELNVNNPVKPKSTVDRIIDAREDNVVARIEQYTKNRRSNAGPAGWRKYATTQNYPYFVAHEIVGELLALERDRLAAK